MISITNVINISVSAPPAGLAGYSINNLLCLTKDTPAVSLGSDLFKVYTNPTDVGTQWGTTSGPYKAAVAVFGQSPNILSGGGKFIVAPMADGGDEVLVDALARIKALVYFGAFTYDFSADSTEVLNAGAAAQAARKIMPVVSSTASDFDGANGLLYKIQNQTLTYVRGLFHSISNSAQAFKWGYIGRAMSTNFSGTGTTQTMQMKQLSGVDVDSGMTETYLGKAVTAGVDTYCDMAGRPTILSQGANGFFDDVYNLQWFIGALEVGGFNALAELSTKLPQTESGMNLLKGAYRKICEQAVANGFVGPGTWTSGDTFGSPEDFRRNIQDVGYYIYSAPISTQSTSDRSARKAPVVQVAVKYQGAIHSSDVIVSINK